MPGSWYGSSSPASAVPAVAQFRELVIAEVRPTSGLVIGELAAALTRGSDAGGSDATESRAAAKVVSQGRSPLRPARRRARCAGLVATIGVPSEKDPARRAAETRSFGATRREVLALADWLRAWQVPAVVMEVTSDYVRREGA